MRVAGPESFRRRARLRGLPDALGLAGHAAGGRRERGARGRAAAAGRPAGHRRRAVGVHGLRGRVLGRQRQPRRARHRGLLRGERRPAGVTARLPGVRRGGVIDRAFRSPLFLGVLSMNVLTYIRTCGGPVFPAEVGSAHETLHRRNCCYHVFS